MAAARNSLGSPLAASAQRRRLGHGVSRGRTTARRTASRYAVRPHNPPSTFRSGSSRAMHKGTIVVAASLRLVVRNERLKHRFANRLVSDVRQSHREFFSSQSIHLILFESGVFLLGNPDPLTRDHAAKLR